MRLDNANHDLASFSLLLPRGLQHGVGLADTGRHPKENLEFAATGLRLVALEARENFVRVWPLRVTHGTSLRSRGNPFQSDRLEAPAETYKDLVIGSAVQQRKCLAQRH